MMSALKPCTPSRTQCAQVRSAYYYERRAATFGECRRRAHLGHDNDCHDNDVHNCIYWQKVCVELLGGGVSYGATCKWYMTNPTEVNLRGIVVTSGTGALESYIGLP